MKATPVVLAPDHEGHCPPVEVQCGQRLPAFDTVARMDAILERLSPDDRVELIPPVEIDAEAAAARVHDPALIDFLRLAWERTPRPVPNADLIFADTFLNPGLDLPGGDVLPPVENAAAFGRYAFDTITGIGPGTWSATRGSIASALTAAARIRDGEALALALCRPPGHHATRTVFGGGCYLNNAAITAQWLRDAGAAKVAVVDVDFHHGNGTQALFYDRADVVYASLHGDPTRCYPYLTGHAEETGTGPGRGANINVPLPAGVQGDQYLAALGRALDAVAARSPEVVVVSLGFDTYRDDVSGDAMLETPDYERVGRAIAELGRPMVVLLEGGYCVPALGANVASWLAGARGRD